MNIKALEQKIRELNKKTEIKYTLYTQREKDILSKTVKLNEEVGELCNDILGILRLQRKAKLDKFDKHNIYQEFADVVITVMQLAIVAGVDIERAIGDKLKTIEERFDKETKETLQNKSTKNTS